MSLETALELDVIIDQIKQYCSFSMGLEQIDSMRMNFEPLIIRRENERSRQALACVVHYDTMPFSGIRDNRKMLENADRGRVLTEQDFLREIQFIQGVKGVLSYEDGLVDVPHAAIRELTDSLLVHESTLRLLLSCFNDYGEVKDSASPDLKDVRNQLRHIDHEISQVAQKFVSSHSASVMDSIITTRNGRTVVLVKASDKNRFGGLVYDDSGSGNGTYIEPASFVAVNNKKEGLMAKEREEIHKILVMCSKEVEKIAKEELANLETLAILDALFAKAQWGKAHDATVATYTKERSLRIEKARHPLIDPAKVIANNYQIVPPHRVLLITGPNTGGKTVSMKVIGLFVLMSNIGIPVTCESAQLPYFDWVFADIGDDQSVVSSLSSFSAHMTKQAEICKKATENSLVLLDEVGSGTDPVEGESLAIAIMNDLREKKCMTVATTHYNRLKAYGKRHEDILLASVQFDHEKLEPTYRFLEGLSGQSNAFEIALRYGLPSGIVSYARFLKSQAKTQEDELIERLEQQLNDNVLKQQELEEAIAENEKKQKELEKKLAQIAREKDTIRQKAQEEANAYLEETRVKADQILKDIRSHQNTAKYHEVISKRHELNAVTQEETTDENVVHDFQVGDAVELRSSNQVCEIIKIEKKDITILLNGREVRVKKNQIRPSSRVIPKMKEEPSVRMSRSNIFSTMSMQCNLIGMHVDEALDAMDAYMDEAKVHNLKSFRIVHGDGSGALRKAVHTRLAKDKSVKEFRLGAPSEGGTGATVVTMK